MTNLEYAIETGQILIEERVPGMDRYTTVWYKTRTGRRDFTGIAEYRAAVKKIERDRQARRCRNSYIMECENAEHTAYMSDIMAAYRDYSMAMAF